MLRIMQAYYYRQVLRRLETWAPMTQVQSMGCYQANRLPPAIITNSNFILGEWVHQLQQPTGAA
jgi:hypothetical protein